MRFLLDTNIVIDARDGHALVLSRIRANRGAIAMSALSLAELHRGLAPSKPEAALRGERLRDLLVVLPVIAFDAEAAGAYGRVIARLGWSRNRDFDRLIAGHALSLDRVIVTANVADFADIPNLRDENWAA